MRVTNTMLVSNFLNNLNTNSTKLEKIQNQLATNKKYAHISDDPISVIYSQQANQKLRKLEHYQRSVTTAQQWLTQTETALMEINNMISSALEACTDAATDIKSGLDKSATGQYIQQLRNQLVDTLNTAFGDKYIFGGYNTTGADLSGQASKPFTFDETTSPRTLYYNGVDISSAALTDLQDLAKDVLTFDVGVGAEMPVTFNGLSVISYGGIGGVSNMFTVLDQLAEKLMDPNATADEVNDFIAPLQEMHSHVLNLVAEVGGRTQRLGILESRYEQDGINYTQMKSDAEDADQAELVMNYSLAQATYEAALASGSRIIQPTLMDFLG